ncbi:muramoyltetrapeptide carboxypeptidase [Enterobacteriaceae bacterium H20N1]|uniref:Muramoyltetrapeptide carboxypeptidase n=1 Tax=Dryocola boscaweniae TaxID=2925397 RepID=A0A9X2W3Z3_9ENTR|nr:muramoyltetrapeptide carboxypeptidase [Dryocola boscaweniae]MCT4700300.1 muramoyltetrapeptide carboxypeptidase [Dryocola boscaweniae]MCT4717527.1 muramoyltetrapeptide carboxypeptidase [Dryocola boscaweniae]
MSLIRLIAPSGYCVNQAAAARGIKRLQEAGYQIENQQAVARRFQRFAGTDEERLAEIQQLASLSPECDIVLAVRGGYGATRLLEKIDFPRLGHALRARTPVICGHSDFTAIQLALLAQCGAITFSGPMLAGNFGAEEFDDYTWQHFWQAITQSRFSLSWQNTAPACSVSGTIWGGNLAMLVSLIGSPWLPAIDGGILVVEDINEHPFRVERMLLQLHHAGILRRQKALILGSFNGATVSDYDAGYDFNEMRAMLSERLSIPVLSGLPFGHEPQTVTLPLGAFGELKHNGYESVLSISGHNVIR